MRDHSPELYVSSPDKEVKAHRPAQPNEKRSFKVSLLNLTSCQNYKTGSKIQTLLGYVIDANVQALARRLPVNVSWNGNRRVEIQADTIPI